ncbi:hypothetical protein WICMUC_003910 [Wickerhamomyces mucosus]|uniref:Calcipressin-like protein n=1 Tax=Wickerhamomyces mucosus TaxID=1378264 RepID=A0A9P8PKN4_9ASCO|nr:hypothetical protein WICMUC_003910 [Wickerhamomyces mucosus]
MVDVTNTLIVTNLSSFLLKDSQFINDIQQSIINELVAQTASDIPIKFIILPKLKRILITFPEYSQSQIVLHYLQAWLQKLDSNAKVGYSLIDSPQEDINHLTIPKHSKMFLISPPVSPPPEFDYDRVEEEPNKLQIYTLEEIQSLQSQYQGHLRTSSQASKHANQPLEIVLKDSQETTPKITLHPTIDGNESHFIETALKSHERRTPIPPKSVFDDVDDSIPYD